MNIFRKECKRNLRPFLFWSLGLFVLVFAGMVKSTGATGDAGSLAALVDSFPRIIMAVFGMADVDIGTFSGFYTVLAQYSVILTAVYAVHLGTNAVSAEAVDQTYEFVFTKPRSRSHILCMKLLAGFAFLLMYCLLHFLFSVLAATQLSLSEDYGYLFALYSLSCLLVGFLFFGLGALLSAITSTAEIGAKLGNYALLLGYCLSVIYNMLENVQWLRWIAPFQYFPGPELLEGRINLLFAMLSIGLAAASLLVAFHHFEKRDLTAA